MDLRLVDILLRALFLTLVAMAAVRLTVLARVGLPASYGALVMAVGIFAQAAWGQLPFSDGLTTTVLVLLLVAVWILLVASSVSSTFRQTCRAQDADPVARFAIGTWVAGTAVVALVIQQVFPSWTSVAVALTLVTVLLWIYFLTLGAQGVRALLIGPLRRQVTGTVLLATVSTQSVAILAQVMAPSDLARSICPALIAMGCILYGGGMILIARRYWQQPNWQLADDWHNTNCIIHGALSITGLAAVSSGILPLRGLAVGWLCVFLLFILIECIELLRLHARVVASGWRRGVLTYDVSQWTRNFTFGMFYAFTLALSHAEAGGAIPHLVLALQEAIVRYADYGVLALLVVELVLFLTHLRSHRAVSRASALAN